MTATPIMGTAAVAQPAGDVMESVLLKGDLAKLTEMERVNYYNAVCKSLGLNPLTRPFDYITLNSRLQLYAKRDACDQLRKLHGISLKIVSAKINSDGIYTVEVEARTPEGREDMDVGAVALPDTVKGEFRANLILKCVTKAKRRATLSICGLGFLDETEVEDIPTAAPERQALKSRPQFEELDDEIPDADESATAAAPEMLPPATGGTGGTDLKLQLLYSAAREAAMKGGHEALRAFFNGRSTKEKAELRKIEGELVRLYPK